ncbi:hypothetical protein [Pontibacter sp. H249]|uniref:hypothetical protein n=1 Tax=Pontibacter sp. H249 TaxID=3133420 RepID=UPI0030C1DEEB
MFRMDDKSSAKELFRSDFLTITAQPDGDYLLADWSGVLDATKARMGCTTVLEILKTNPHSKILNNNTRVTGHYPGAIDWVGTVWFPMMSSLGVKWFAWVYSPEFYTQLGTDEVIRLSSQVKICTFYDIEDAKQWLATYSVKNALK